MKNLYLLIALIISINTQAQSDTLYILKNGVIVYQQAVAPATIDSIVFYKPQLETVIDVDGNAYKTVILGDQTWMAENLRSTQFNDGTDILKSVSNDAWYSHYSDQQPAYCWLFGDSATYAQKCGATYNWYAVNTGKLCPEGWHVPDSLDWTELYTYLTDNGYGFDKAHPNRVAQSLASKSDWLKYTSSEGGTPGDDLSKNNRSCFNGIPVPARNFYGEFSDMNRYASWWSSTSLAGASAGSAYYWFIGHDNDRLLKINAGYHYGMSVRCLKD